MCSEFTFYTQLSMGKRIYIVLYRLRNSYFVFIIIKFRIINLLNTDLVTEDWRECWLFVDLSTLEEAERVNVQNVSLRWLRGNTVQLDVVNLFTDTESIDCGLFLETTRLNFQDWWITGTAVSDQENLVGDLWAITEFRLEGIVDDPFDGKTGVSTATLNSN